MPEDQPELQQNEQASWIRKIQERSWEAELLISGGAIFSLVQLWGWLGDLVEKSLDGAFVALLLVGPPIYVATGIISGFSLHLILRGFWISIVILQRVYPAGIDVSKFNFTSRFQQQLEQINLDDYVVKLDRLCSLVFVWAFACTVFGVGLTIASTVFSILPALITSRPELVKNVFIIILNWLNLLFAFGWFLFFYIDLFSTGFLRRRKWIARFYFPIYQFYNYLSLGILWRPILQSLLSNNRHRRKTIAFVISYYLLALISSGFLYDKTRIISLFDDRKYVSAEMATEQTFYQDKLDNSVWTGPTIQSAVIKENYIEIFYPHSWRSEPDSVSGGASPNFFYQLIGISVDDSIHLNLPWVELKKVNGERGIFTVVDIEGLRKGRHIVKMKSFRKTVEIPFWKE